MNDDPGFVYLLAAGDGVFKIGKTTRLSNRIKKLSIQLPRPVEVAAVVFSLNVSGLEHELHQCYQSSRLNGEWFELNEKQLEQFSARALIGAVLARAHGVWGQYEEAVACGLISEYAQAPWSVI